MKLFPVEVQLFQKANTWALMDLARRRKKLSFIVKGALVYLSAHFQSERICV